MEDDKKNPDLEFLCKENETGKEFILTAPDRFTADLNAKFFYMSEVIKEIRRGKKNER